MTARQLTFAETTLIEKIATRSSKSVLTGSRPRIKVSDELDEQGQIQGTTA